ncbi:MAG: hypothetical protein B7Y16_03835 [Methylotenera sp. 24-45-7]|jgi:diguanylate cyclase (GGDEF)-like protein/PAS domain S-box-containing protein|nr:MAG: hypothetical protein B7Y16_03835 [Methylotenera sp. 24-45-7]OZA54410.1 MAG: hypothetical protein B7X73_00905 [Methylophilales bacterium 39-45-7]HQS37375.1 EAL domain-containing protein [Methylotenera sp.]HQS43173.1 EAL domain-containing protein [Methylotenera sp.]
MNTRLHELEEALRALAYGSADAVVITGEAGEPPQIISFENANLPYRILIDTMSEGAAALTPDSEILYANPALCHLLGKTSPAEIVGMKLYDIFPDQCAGALRTLLASVGNKKVAAEFDCLDQGGELQPAMLSLSPIINRGNTIGVMALIVDTTEHKKAMQHIQFLAHHDPLTGLPNRSLLADRCKQAIAEARRRNTQVGLLFIDLDRFKTVNDTLGHIVGDSILESTARKLQNQIRQEDTLARIGGDEFIVLLPALPDGKDASVVASKIVNAFLTPMSNAGQEIHISTSVGIAIYPENGNDFFELLKSADAAMYQAKKQGKSRYVFASAEMNSLLSYQFTVEQSFRDALLHHEFVAYYQPRVSIATGKIIGAEALVRWKKHDGEIISPANFIPIAEETGLIDPLGRQMLEMVCSQIQQWKLLNIPIFPISVNVSAVQLRADDFIAHFTATTQQYGVSPTELEIEITESNLIQEGITPLLKLEELRKIGHRILLDDFGTGFSSLSYISKLPFDTIKVAQEFMRHQSHEQQQIEFILIAIVALAKGLQKTVMVEGVETIDQLNIVTQLGFEEYQGYFFSKPLCKDSFEKLLTL